MTRTIADALREEGRAQGALENSRLLLRQALEQRFRTIPEALVRQIEEATDLERVQAAVLQALKLEKLEDLQL